MLIDTHLHIVDQNALNYPWLKDAPALNKDALYGEYAREADRARITHTLHMEVDVAEHQMAAETDYVQSIAQGASGQLIGATAACRPESADFPAYLEKALSNPFVKGLRRVLHTMPDDLSEQTIFRDNILRMSNTGLTFDLCMLPRQAKQALALLDLAPDVKFVLDHCGVPNIKGKDFASWAPGITEIAKRPNVTAKISGIMAYTDTENWTLADLQPYVDHVIASFGWNRVIWGSDYPVCTLAGSLSTWVAATNALITGCSNDEKAQLFSRNAIKLWDLTISK